MATYRGTTPSVVCRLPCDAADIAELWVTFAQGSTQLTKTLSDFSVVGTTATVILSQAETLMFRGGVDINVQGRVRFADGTAAASAVKRLSLRQILREGTI